MAATLGEVIISGGGSFGSQNDHYREAMVFDCTDLETAVTTAQADVAFPITYSVTLAGGVPFNFIRGVFKGDPVLTPDDDGLPTTWKVHCKYDLMGYSAQPYNTGDSNYCFEIGRSSVNVKQSLKEIAFYGTGAVTQNGTVNVGPDGVAEGTEVTYPIFTFSETHVIAATALTTGYKQALWAAANNPINLYDWREYAAGEAFFLGVQGTERHKGGDVELNFHWAASPNVTDLTPDGPITGIVKKGWEYCWFLFQQQIASGKRSTKPTAAYVNQMYRSTDFATLGVD